MPDPQPIPVEPETLGTASSAPLVFISHDSPDAELADAFSTLLKSVSAGMIKTFRSSDKKGSEGIDFGDEWYKRLMLKLQATSDVVCLFTERSLDRPWILFEAGVAKGKLNTPVIGIALGVPPNRVSAGPFYQFQNMEDSEVDLAKLVNQLAKRVPGLELDPDVVKVQVTSFKSTEASILKTLGDSVPTKTPKASEEESSVAKLLEEMKALPSRVADRLGESGDPFRRRRMRRLHPMMFEEMMHMSGEPDDPVAILMAASLVRDDAPWLYELAMEVYRAAKSGDAEAMRKELSRLQRLGEMGFHFPLADELGMGDRESHFMFMEFPRILQRMLSRRLESPDSPHVPIKGRKHAPK